MLRCRRQRRFLELAMRGRSGAYYEGLPIYKAAVEVAVTLDGVVRRFGRHHKYALGLELRRQSIEIVQLVAAANRRDGRAAAQERLCKCAENLKILVNLGKELQAFASFAQFAQVASQVVDLARQAEAWRRHSLGAGPERTAAPSSGES